MPNHVNESELINRMNVPDQPILLLNLNQTGTDLPTPLMIYCCCQPAIIGMSDRH